jgi:hypothetical protein
LILGGHFPLDRSRQLAAKEPGWIFGDFSEGGNKNAVLLTERGYSASVSLRIGLFSD